MLSKKTQYGFKAMIHLSRLVPGELALISDIAKSENIPKRFLESILVNLKHHGLLASKMGRGGGYYLTKPPEKITLATLYRILEGPIALLPCVSLNFYQKCGDYKDEESCCALREVMVEVRDSSLKILENRTLADLI